MKESFLTCIWAKYRIEDKIQKNKKKRKKLKWRKLKKRNFVYEFAHCILHIAMHTQRQCQDIRHQKRKREQENGLISTWKHYVIFKCTPCIYLHNEYNEYNDIVCLFSVFSLRSSFCYITVFLRQMQTQTQTFSNISMAKKWDFKSLILSFKFHNSGNLKIVQRVNELISFRKWLQLKKVKFSQCLNVLN